MLPELLFSVGNSMQDISREDFNLLNGGCDKDVTVTRSSPMPATPPTAATGYQNRTDTPSSASPASPIIDSVSIKLEDNSPDIYTTPSWHHPHHHHTEIGSTKLLLRNSDDPLISRGATAVDDDNPNEFNTIVAASTGATTPDSSAPAPTVTPPKRNKNVAGTGTRTRRKGAFKLRFHHQALPAEYLTHYEATQNQQNKAIANQRKSEQARNAAAVAQHQANAHETVRSWLQKISEAQANVKEQKVPMETAEDVVVENNTSTTINSQKSPRRVINYSDLPYMGEMTLENSKPRRGRKPKKADICHLIYKNYGTIFPGTPKDLVENETKSDIKITSSLLEKRLSGDVKEESDTPKSGAIKSEEPLNLCLRDQSTDSLTISSDGEDSNDCVRSSRTTPIPSPADAATDALLAANLKMSLPNFQSALLDKSSDDTQTPSTESDPTQSPNYVYWPTAGVFIHPMALYYQKMIDAGTLPPPVKPPTPSSPSQNMHSPSSLKKTPSPKISAKSLSQLIKKESVESPEPCSTPSSIKSNTSSTHPPQPPQKRKRSAIFIPPMPAENTTNPATEVSICKFKFTGGAKPSLQEKKMLSVDSDGNYRYYSGTGDKSMRGYEFFPRESLQQSGGLPGVNCSNAFLNATGEKITSNDIPPPSVGLSNELLQIPDSPPGSLILPHSQHPTVPGNGGNTTHHRHFVGSSAHSSDRRKRKSRRSLQREKLEQTFKEKGFLIQTQQLESAEGATYCKFRQLRKFTRYLFRSWKDYLPGELQQANAAAAAAAASNNQPVQHDGEAMSHQHQQHHHQQQQQQQQATTAGSESKHRKN